MIRCIGILLYCISKWSPPRISTYRKIYGELVLLYLCWWYRLFTDGLILFRVIISWRAQSCDIDYCTISTWTWHWAVHTMALETQLFSKPLWLSVLFYNPGQKQSKKYKYLKVLKRFPFAITAFTHRELSAAGWQFPRSIIARGTRVHRRCS